MEIVKIVLRAVQFLWTLLITALIGNVIDDNKNGHMSAINFAMFCAVMSWLAVIWGLGSSVAASLGDGIFSMIGIALDVIAILFNFIAGIVLAAKLGGANCSGNHAGRSSSWIAFGSEDVEKRCREIQASTAFFWFLFVSFLGTLALTVMGGGLRGRRGGSSGGSSAPHMSQVRV